MLEIRTAQLHVFSGAAYVDQTADYVCRDFPAYFEAHGRDGVASLVERASTDAARYGLRSSVDVTGILSLMIILKDEDFVEKPEHAWIKGILESEIIHPTAKIGMVLQELVARSRKRRS